MPAVIPTEDEVLGYFDSLSNWGRWGDDDQRGTLNLIGDSQTRRAAALVREGATVSCAATISFDPAPDVSFQPHRYMLESGDGWAGGDKVSSFAIAVALEYVGMVFHGHTITHIDSLAHFFWKGQMYNGRPCHLVSTNHGATSHSVERAGDGIVTRGVLVDVPMIRGVEWLERNEGVMPDDILLAEERCGFKVEEGDVLLIRTGQLKRRRVEGPVDPRTAGSTACQAACLPLFHERGIAMLGTDTGNDIMPPQYPTVTNPIHQVGLVAMGMWVLDNADLEELTAACRRRDRWEFMFSIGPLKISNGTGSPVNPLAIF